MLEEFDTMRITACKAEEDYKLWLRFEDGLLHPGDQMGLGVELDSAAAGEHRYEPAYLPVNRLQDGTVHDW